MYIDADFFASRLLRQVETFSVLWLGPVAFLSCFASPSDVGRVACVCLPFPSLTLVVFVRLFAG